MPRERQKRDAAARVFLITGVDQKERITLGKHIQRLGAVYVKTEHFQNNATHVVCGKLSRSEKFLGALALGRWVVRPEYITASLQAGKWLDEAEYEWSSLTVEGHDRKLAIAAKQNRWRVSMSTEKIFMDWHVAVVMSDQQRQAVYKRLLVCGGAKVMDLKLPAKNPVKCSEYLTYLFSDSTMVPLAQSLQNNGVLCLNADYISDCIILHPMPEPLDYMLPSDAVGQRPQTVTSHSALDDSSSSQPVHQTGAPRSAPSTVTHEAQSFDRDDDDDDMLVLTQCTPSERRSVSPRTGRGRNGVVEVIDVDANDSDDFEDNKGKEHRVYDADRHVTHEETDPSDSSDIVILGNSRTEEEHADESDVSIIKENGSFSAANDDVILVSDNPHLEDSPTVCKKSNSSAPKLLQHHKSIKQEEGSLKERLQTSAVVKGVSKHHKEKVNCLQRSSSKERCLHSDGKAKKVHSMNLERKCSEATSAATVGKLKAACGSDHLHLKSSSKATAGNKCKKLTSAACSSVEDNSRQTTLPLKLPHDSSQLRPSSSKSAVVTSKQSSSRSTSGTTSQSSTRSAGVTPSKSSSKFTPVTSQVLPSKSTVASSQSTSKSAGMTLQSSSKFTAMASSPSSSKSTAVTSSQSSSKLTAVTSSQSSSKSTAVTSLQSPSKSTAVTSSQSSSKSTAVTSSQSSSKSTAVTSQSSSKLTAVTSSPSSSKSTAVTSSESFSKLKALTSSQSSSKSTAVTSSQSSSKSTAVTSSQSSSKSTAVTSSQSSSKSTAVTSSQSSSKSTAVTSSQSSSKSTAVTSSQSSSKLTAVTSSQSSSTLTAVTSQSSSKSTAVTSSQSSSKSVAKTLQSSSKSKAVTSAMTLSQSSFKAAEVILAQSSSNTTAVTSTSTAVTSQSSTSMSTAVTSSQSSTSRLMTVTTSQSSLVSRVETSVPSSTSTVSSPLPLPSLTPSKPAGRKRTHKSPVTVTDVKKELKKLKMDMRKGLSKQSLVPGTPRKVQTSLQHWFLPAGKENTNKATVTTTESEAKSHRQKSLGSKVQHQNKRMNEKLDLQTLEMAVLSKEGIVRTLPEEVKGMSASEVKSKRTSQMHRTAGSSSSASGRVFEHQKLKSRIDPHLANEHEVKLSVKHEVKLSVSKSARVSSSDVRSVESEVSSPVCSFDSTSLHPAQPDCMLGKNLISESESRHAISLEVPASNTTGKVDPVKKPGDSYCGDDTVSAGSGGDEFQDSSDTPCKPSLENGSVSSGNEELRRAPAVEEATVVSTDHGQEHRDPSIPVGVLSPRSANKRRYCKRVRTHTALMKNYLSILRKKRKAEEPASTAAEQPSPCKSPKVDQAKTSPSKRRKTVRGLGVRCEQTSYVELTEHHLLTKVVSKECNTFKDDSVQTTSLSAHQRIQTEKDKTENEEKVVDSSVATNHDVRSSLPAVVHESQAVKPLPDLTAELPTSSASSCSKWLLPCARWRLSRAPLPKQYDVRDCHASSLKTLGSNTGVSDSLVRMICSCLDENYYQSAVDMAHSAVNFSPSVELFQRMVSTVKEADSQSVVNQANAVLMSWLDKFPPVTPSLRSIYEEAMRLNDWESFHKVLEEAVIEAETETKEACQVGEIHCGARMVLRIVMSALEKNFLHFAHSVSRQSRYNCLILRCLWSPSYQVYPNGRTADVMLFLERAFKCLDSPKACWQELLTLVSMATQCCYLADKGWQWSVDGQVERCSSPMVQKLTQAITGGGVDSAVQLQQVLASVSPPWLLRQVVATLLEDYDDYLVPGGFTSDPITLKSIVTKYFFLLPKLSSVDKSQSPSARKKLKRDPEEKDENKAVIVDPKLTAEKINKKNLKGETMLHRAAIKNNIAQLKQMLAVPGVDVNSQDYAGWTPLHEACNHGHVECVRALLKFVPSATLDSFFHTGNGKKMRKVDLLVGNRDGITPLHDAVLMNHVGVVKLLLKYGGSSLLKPKTVYGYTALDLAKTEEMRQLLTRDPVDFSFSQDSFTQDLGSQERETVPSSFMYREVLDSSNGDTQVSASLEEVHKFLTLITLLLRSHLQVQRQQQQLQEQQSELQPGLSQNQQNTPETEKFDKDMRFYLQSFERHVKKITTEDVFRRLRVPMCVLEALLMECR